MSNDVIEAVSKKDADFIEKFVRRVLKLTEDNWAHKTIEAQAVGNIEEYKTNFVEWHRIRQDSYLFELELVSDVDRSDAKPEEEKIPQDSVAISPTREWRKRLKESVHK